MHLNPQGKVGDEIVRNLERLVAADGGAANSELRSAQRSR